MKVLSKKGFTLLEVMVVLLIIGLIAALVIPAIRIVQQIRRDTQRKAFAREVNILLEAYHDKENSYAQTLGFASPGSCSTGEVEIAGKKGTSTIEKICTKSNFNVVYNSAQTCATFQSTYTKGEETSGDLHMCYEQTKQGYEFFLLVERSTEPYNAGNE